MIIKHPITNEEIDLSGYSREEISEMERMGMNLIIKALTMN